MEAKYEDECCVGIYQAIVERYVVLVFLLLFGCSTRGKASERWMFEVDMMLTNDFQSRIQTMLLRPR